MLDLYAGVGGASAAMCRHGWQVVLVEIDSRLCPAAQYRDIHSFSWRGPRPDLVWASPPCQEFSCESMPWCKTGRTPSMDLVYEAVRIIRETQPRFWVVENTRGAIPWFRPLLGDWQAHTGPFFFWGVFPPVDLPYIEGRHKQRWTGEEAWKRSIIPYSISDAFRRAIEAASV